MNTIERLKTIRSLIAICARVGWPGKPSADTKEGKRAILHQLDVAIAELEPKPPVEEGGIYKATYKADPQKWIVGRFQGMRDGQFFIKPSNCEVYEGTFKDYTFTRLVPEDANG